MTTPDYLPNTGVSTSWGTSVEVRLRSATSTRAVYGAWNPAANGGVGGWFQTTAKHSIRVGTDPNTTSEYNIWVDNLPIGTSDPHHISESTVNGIVYVNLWNNTAMTSLIYQFEKPTVASWISTGGSGTGTEGVAVPQGSIARTSPTNVRVVIDKNSPSSSATVTYSLQVDGVSYGPGITHTQNTTSDFVTNLTFVTGTWRLWYEETGSGDQKLAERYYFNSKRRVHCNFW